jgi:chemotaxis protein MotB
MILLAFFIMLNSLATPDVSRSRAAMGSLVGTFGTLPGFEQQRLQVELEYESSKSQKAGNDLEKLVRTKLEGETNLLVEKHDDGRIVVSVGPDLIFKKGGVEISPAAFNTLDQLAELVHDLRMPVRIEGHADASPSASNWYLSARRAASVYRYMAANHKVRPEQVTAAGFGDSQPDRAGVYRARVEVIFLPVKGGKK